MKFHKTSRVACREDLKCRKDCQAQQRWRKCDREFECRDVPVKDVLEKTMEVLNEQRDDYGRGGGDSAKLEE